MWKYQDKVWKRGTQIYQQYLSTSDFDGFVHHLQKQLPTHNSLISLMIQQSQQSGNTLQQLINNLHKNTSTSIKLETYQQIIHFLQNSTPEDFSHESVYLMKLVPISILAGLVEYILEKLSLKNNNHSLLNTLLGFFKERLESETIQRNKIYVENLMISKSTLLQALVMSCSQSRERAFKLLYLANQMLNDKLNKEEITNINFTFTTALAFRIIQSPSSSRALQQQALRHLLIVDLIQKGQVTQLIISNQILLDVLIEIGRKGEINPYWLALVSNIAQFDDIEGACGKIYQLEEQGIELVKKSVQAGKDLTEEIFNILQSDKSDQDKKKTLQIIRAVCLFVSNYLVRLLRTGSIDEQVVALLQQLMDIKDFLAFQFIARAYAQIVQLEQRKDVKLTQELISKIQKNCLPLARKKFLQLQEYDSAKVSFLANRFQSLVEYDVSSESAQAMKILSDKILGGRGCLSKATICSCYDSYIHDTIEAQYEQVFNEHEFMSVTHLMCRQITRVCDLRPSEEQLNNLKEYLINNIKWLLNLNESCVPEHRKCINFKTLDVILSFPYILRKNQFLEKVTFDLLLDRMPHTFHHLHTIINFLKSQQSNSDLQNKLDQASEKLIEKAKNDGWSLRQKICIWELVISIHDNTEKLNELLQVYSLYQDHWIAKHCAASLRKIKLPESFQAKGLQIINKMKNNPFFFKAELKTIEMCSK